MIMQKDSEDGKWYFVLAHERAPISGFMPKTERESAIWP